jgi:GAF domain-containing protein
MTVTANPFNRETLIGDVVEGWQSMLNLAAELLIVPAGLITRIDRNEIEIFLSSESAGNPYSVGYKTQYPESGFYCEWVAKTRKGLVIPDARQDPMWMDNSAAKMGMIAYLGMPILRPDGEVFGTICFLDNKANPHTQAIQRLVEQFKRMIELSLHAIYATEEMKRRDDLLHGLSKIFPICAYCKKVCNSTAEWISVESYINDISGLRASHGVCPECYQKELQRIGDES